MFGRKRPQQYSGRPASPESAEVDEIFSKPRKQLKFNGEVVNSESNSSLATMTQTMDENILDSPSSPDVREMVYVETRPIKIPLSSMAPNFGGETQSFLDPSPEREPIQIATSPVTSDYGYETQNLFESPSEEANATDRDGELPEHSTPSPIVSEEKVTQVYLPRAWKDRYSERSLKKAICEVVDGYPKSGTYLKMGGLKTKLKVCTHGNMQFKPVAEQDERPIILNTLRLHFTE